MKHAAWVLLLALLAPAARAGESKRRPWGIELGGFVQTSWQASPTNQANDFRFDEVQLEVGRRWKDAVTVRVHFQYRHADHFDAQGNLRSFDFNNLLEQGWVRLDLLRKRLGLTFTFGKLALPIGFERVNAPRMYQYSRSYTADVGRPNFGTGILLRWRRAVFDLALYAINGWNTLSDNNDAKTFGGRLGFRVLDNKLRFGLAYVGGPEPIPNRPYENVRSFRHVLDADLTFRPTERLTIGAELNFGHEDRANQVVPERSARWLSLLGTIHYRWLPWLGSTLRFEHADDPGSSRLYHLLPQVVATPPAQQWLGVPLTVEALTLALRFRFAPGGYATLEWRSDWLARGEDPPIFPAADDTLTKTRHLFSASIFYAW